MVKTVYENIMITNDALSIAYDYVQYLDDIEIDRTTEIIN